MDAPAHLLTKEISWQPLLSRHLLRQWATSWNRPEYEDMEARRTEQRKGVLVFGALGCIPVIKCCCRKINHYPMRRTKKKLLRELLQWFNLLCSSTPPTPVFFFGFVLNITWSLNPTIRLSIVSVFFIIVHFNDSEKVFCLFALVFFGLLLLLSYVPNKLKTHVYFCISLFPDF